MLLWPHKQALNATIGDSVISCLEPLYQKGFTFFWHGLENRNGACLLMTHYLGVIGNIKPLLKAWTLPLMTVRGYEDVTSSDLEFSLAPRVTSVGCGHNTDGHRWWTFSKTASDTLWIHQQHVCIQNKPSFCFRLRVHEQSTALLPA